ncbi:MAG: Maf family nucleotide pyrophosphatase [Planctomycetota bacterium]|jgi:septum formation protein|nr:Maf family nucleotide pyrophosphatase [Planctomycetota bacterium]
MLTRWRRRAAVFLVALFPLFLFTSFAADFPHAPRLAIGPDGEAFGGWQAIAGDGSEFELFVQHPGGPASGLGRFAGILSGVAVDSSGRRLVLTSDGSLAVHADELTVLAFPDARWQMMCLALLPDGLAALHRDSVGALWLARPEAAGAWSLDGSGPMVVDARIDRAAFAVLDGEAHLLWSAGADDFSRGALRHLVRRGDGWLELPPLPLGDVRSFAFFRKGDGLELAALVPEPLDRAPSRLALRIWRRGQWLAGRELPEELTRLLSRNFDLAGAAGMADAEARWLSVGAGGVFLDGRAAIPVRTPVWNWFDLVVPATLAFFIFILILHCRRSRRLSRIFPGYPVDLASRGAALVVDWLLASAVTAAYHVASGNVRIYAELLNFGDISLLFWLGLGTLSIYSAVFEGLWGATPGKLLAGIRIRSVSGGPPSLAQVMIRNLFRAVDMFPVFFPGTVGAVIALFNPGSRRLGDLLAGTMARRHIPVESRKFVLASASPRRKELMAALGVDFSVEPADIDESSFRGDSPGEIACLLSMAKAKKIADRISGGRPGPVIVAADTMVIMDGTVFGKPKDAVEAAEMLSRLSGRSHTVVTGVTLLDLATGQGVSDVESTEVEMRELTCHEINSYVAGGDPLDKAGAYGVQSGFLVKQIRGSLSNVMGLPMEILQGMLAVLDS